MAPHSAQRERTDAGPSSRRQRSSAEQPGTSRSDNIATERGSRPHQPSAHQQAVAGPSRASVPSGRGPTTLRQVSAGEFHAKTAQAAAANATAAGAGSSQTTGRKRSSTLVASGLVAQETTDEQPGRQERQQSVGPSQPGPSTLRHPAGTVARLPSLTKIPEGVYEPESPRYKRSRLQHASMQVEPTAPANVAPGDRSRTMPTEALSRALPRGFDPATGRVREDRSSRPSLPFIFGDDRSPYSLPSNMMTPASEFPNPHTPVIERDFEMTTAQLQRRTSDATMPNTSRDGKRKEIPPTPPLASTLAPFGGRSDRPHPADVGDMAEDRSAASQEQLSEWSSDTSSPTPTASSVAAGIARREKEKVQLIPIQLIHPASYAQPTRQQVQAPKAAVAGPRAEAKRFNDKDVVVQAGKAVPLVRTDLQNLKRLPASAIKPRVTSSSTMDRSVQSNTDSGTTLADFSPERGVAAQATVQTVESTFGRSPHITTAQKKPAPKLLSVGGHVLGTSKATLLARKDGSSRPIYSPLPITVAAVEQQSRAAQAATNKQATSGALPASTAAPPAPQLQQHQRFVRRDANLTSPDESPLQYETTADELSQPIDSRRATVAPAPPHYREEGETSLPSDILDPSLLREANRKLSLYQQQQQKNDEKERSVKGSSNPAAQTDVVIRVESATDVGSKGARNSMTRPTDVHANAASHPRRDSVDSASTAFDPEDAGVDMLKTLSGRQQEKRRSISRDGKPSRSFDSERRFVPGGLVAPPSDVPEGKEPSESRTNLSQHTASYAGARPRQLIIDTTTDTRGGESHDQGKSDFRFVPILNMGGGARAARPRTGNTRVSFRSGHSREGRAHNMPACRNCFRAGFDVAMNLHLGEGTTGRKAFQDFVAAGGLNALSIRDGVHEHADGSIYEQSVTVGDALGRNYVDKLGEVAFGESALSRPVTRGMIDNLLEEKQEQEVRGRLVSDHKPWSADVEDEDEELPKKPSLGGHERRFSQVTLQDEPLSLIARNLAAGPEEKFDIDPRDYDSFDDSTATDDLIFLPDRWPTWRKIYHILILGIYVCAMQALGSGWTSAIPFIAAEMKDVKALSFGMLCFNGAQPGGVLIGCHLVGLGRQRILLIALVLVGIVSVIVGFANSVAVTLILHAVLGELSGIVIYINMATVMDLFDTYSSRLWGLVLLVFAVSIGQLSGPWIAKLILTQASWPWQYWSMLGFTVVMIMLIGICTKETNPSLLFRRHVQKLRRVEGSWTPEPQPVPTWSQIFREDGPRPWRILFSSWIMPVLIVADVFFLSVFIFMYAGIIRVYTDVQGLSLTMGALASTVSGIIGLLGAIFVLFVIDSRINNTPDLRSLHIDEKGYINATKAEHKVERVLVGTMAGSVLFSVSLYTLALTSRMNLAWIFTSFGVMMHTAAIVMIVVSTLQYSIDAFSEAGPIKIGDVTAREEPSSKPVSRLSHRDDPYTAAPRSLLRRASDETVSSVNKRDRRWGTEMALASFSMVVFVTVSVANNTYLPSTMPSLGISFQAYAVIFASASLLAIVAPLMLYMYGAKARHAAIAKLDHKERVREFTRLEKAREEKQRHEDEEGRPHIRSSRASRVVPWISKCLSGDTVISASNGGDATHVRARAQAHTDGLFYIPPHSPTRSPTGSERTRRKELYLTRILSERAKEAGTSPGRPLASHVRRGASEEQRLPAGTSGEADAFANIPLSRPLTPVMQRGSRDLSRINLLSSSPDAREATTVIKPRDANGKYWQRSNGRADGRGHKRSDTHDGSRTRLVETAAVPAGQAQRKASDGRGRFDLWVS